MNSRLQKPGIFAETMRGLETGLMVAHIACFNLRTCEVFEDAKIVLSKPELNDYDQIPVLCDSRVVGVLERASNPHSGQVQEHMRTLQETLLVSAEGPLMSFIRVADKSLYRLVVRTTEICGIVTRSDLLKLPVRLLVFGMITHLESLMADLIREECHGDNQKWLKYLSEGRQKKIMDKQAWLKKQKADPELLELTEFCDKRDIVRKLRGLKSEFVKDLKEVESLRNSLFHAGEFTPDDDGVRIFVKSLMKIELWIESLA